MKPLYFLSSPLTLSLSECSEKILLLQGPAGPFFKNLQYEFEAKGFAVKRVLFHQADQLFAGRDNIHKFSGDNTVWKKWLRTEFKQNRPDVIVLFGSNRPAHTTARKIAHAFGIEVMSLEEGYLRSGYITCEFGGNNQHSPLHDWTATELNALPQNPLPILPSFFTMCFWQAIYYLWRELTQSSSDQALYHRKTQGVIREAALWTRHGFRRFFAKFADRNKIAKLLTECAGNYLLVTLQTPSDAQIQAAGRGWTNEKLVRQVLRSLEEILIKNQPAPALVFKTHPLDQKSHALVSLIQREARALNLIDKVVVLESGKIGALAQHAAGMIVINSTSAFSALHHRIPLLVLGDAIFRRPTIATVGEDARSITHFFVNRKSKNPADIDAFIEAVKTHALLPGDFYTRKTQQITAQHVVAKVRAHLRANKTMVNETALEAAP